MTEIRIQVAQGRSDMELVFDDSRIIGIKLWADPEPVDCAERGHDPCGSPHKKLGDVTKLLLEFPGSARPEWRLKEETG